MTKDDQRVRETVQAELRRRRDALDRSEEERAARPAGHATSNGHAARPPGEERRALRDPHGRRQWSPPSPSGTTSE